MDEILYELRDHSAGLNCGRWDYIFSAIKKFRNDPDVHPARPRAGHDDDALHARLLAAASSRHATGAASHAMGGMAALIPIKGDPEA